MPGRRRENKTPAQLQGSQLNSRARRRQREYIASPEAGFGGSWTPEEKKGDVACVGCGARLTEPPLPNTAKLERDRIVEGHLGGHYERSNLQPMCPDCNKAKNAKNWASPLSQGAMPAVEPEYRSLSPMQFGETLGVNWP